MASVQNPSFPPQGIPAIPSGLTQHDIQQAYQVRQSRSGGEPYHNDELKRHQLMPAPQKYKQMTADKVPKTDPEYQKVWGLLAALQRHKVFKDQKQQQIQQMKLAQQQQMQLQHKVNGEAHANGINGQCFVQIY